MYGLSPQVAPLSRSGHTLTQFGGKIILFGGTVNGIEDPNIKRVGPSNDLWLLDIFQKNMYGWQSLKPRGDIPTPRTNHTATTVKKNGRDDFIFIFGGMGEKGKLEDCYRFDYSDAKFTKYEIKGDSPAPRANHSACCHEGKVYVFGGNGGRGYENSIFKDLWVFDPEDSEWQLVPFKENPTYPELRTCHSMFIYNKQLYIYGGWNNLQGFSSAIKYTFATQEWESADMNLEGYPVWNHCGLEVESGPGWKYFIFGGTSKEFDETKLRERAESTNKMIYCDMEDEKLNAVNLNEEIVLPESREDAAMIYYQHSKNLLLFGGWNNEWFGDIYGICVSAIVGPSYSVKSIYPNMGRISGNQEITLFGSKLSNGNITVYFILGSKYAQTTATLIDDTKLTFMTPVFSDPSFINPGTRFQGTKDCEVYIKIDNEELSTNPIKFSIYYDTDAGKSIFFGPACITGGTPNVPTSLKIRARNDENENRLSGLDNFEVTVVSENDMTKSVETKIEDHNDGTYTCTFTPPDNDKYRISVKLIGDKEKVDIRGSPVSVEFSGTDPANNEMVGKYMVEKFLKENVEKLEEEMKRLENSSITEGKDLNDINVLIDIKNSNKEIEKVSDNFDLKINQLLEYYIDEKIGEKKALSKEVHKDRIENLSKMHAKLEEIRKNSAQEISPIINDKTIDYQNEIKDFYSELNKFGPAIKKENFATDYNMGYERAFEDIDKKKAELDELDKKLQNYTKIMSNLGYPEETAGCIKSIENSKNEIELVTEMWSFIKETQELFEKFKQKAWPEIDGQAMDDEISQKLTKKNNAMRKKLGSYSLVMDCVQKEINVWKKLVPLITYLKNDYMQERHWEEVRKELNSPDLVIGEELKLQRFYDMKIQEKAEQIQEITDKASSEDKMGKKLDEIEKNWGGAEFIFKDYERVPGIKLLNIDEDQYAILEENMQQLQTMIRNKYKAHFEDRIVNWRKYLNEINEVWVALSDTQKTWTFLESLFIGSDEIKRELPNETEEFVKIDQEVKEILKNGFEKKNIKNFSNSKFPMPPSENTDNDASGSQEEKERSLLDWLKDILVRLSKCEKALNLFMERKRADFPRFYFMSSVDLLDVLSKGNSPRSINKHISKIIIAMEKLEMQDNDDKSNPNRRPTATEMITRTGVEKIPFETPFALMGKVEVYLVDILKNMQSTIKSIVKKSISEVEQKQQREWIESTPSQACLLTDLMKFVTAVEKAINNLSKNSDALKQALEAQTKSLSYLIELILEDLTEETMAKVMVLIKSETHSRDVIDKLIQEKVSRTDDFIWQSQMKAYWDSEKDDCHLDVCDASINYGYEYLGNGDRLVVTPLTDRIYVTATQALHLKMGCSPAGPAGTGKTETTKDLASAMGKACYVFNCSEQMDYKGMGDIFKGLAASGSWGCFDEFNRLVPEVLSVCSMQFKCVIDALKRGDKEFMMEEKKCQLDPSCGVFITMNPGYLGRSELPEGLKALFRPITVVVPDFGMISENCLMAQGFQEAKMLAKKFVVLYALCQDLLSKQMHYDWGLRAIKSVLVVAGAFKRADRNMTELQLLKRALRDFNYPKIVQDDIPIFDGLIGDLFPNVEKKLVMSLTKIKKRKEWTMTVPHLLSNSRKNQDLF